jgi:hypothetical protein
LLAASHASVKPLGHEIGQPIVNDDLDFDVGIFPQELCKLRQQDGVGGIFGGGYPNRTGWLFPKFRYSRELSVDLLKT